MEGKFAANAEPVVNNQKKLGMTTDKWKQLIYILMMRMKLNTNWSESQILVECLHWEGWTARNSTDFNLFFNYFHAYITAARTNWPNVCQYVDI
jgi:hypothetical protein